MKCLNVNKLTKCGVKFKFWCGCLPIPHTAAHTPLQTLTCDPLTAHVQGRGLVRTAQQQDER